MKTRKISTYYADNQKGYAEVHVDFVQNINLKKIGHLELKNLEKN